MGWSSPLQLSSNKSASLLPVIEWSTWINGETLVIGSITVKTFSFLPFSIESWMKSIAHRVCGFGGVQQQHG